MTDGAILIRRDKPDTATKAYLNDTTIALAHFGVEPREATDEAAERLIGAIDREAPVVDTGLWCQDGNTLLKITYHPKQNEFHGVSIIYWDMREGSTQLLLAHEYDEGPQIVAAGVPYRALPKSALEYLHRPK